MAENDSYQAGYNCGLSLESDYRQYANSWFSLAVSSIVGYFNTAVGIGLSAIDILKSTEIIQLAKNYKY